MQPILRQVPPKVGVLLDHGDLQAELRRADGADIAAGAGADDDEIVGHQLASIIRTSCPTLSRTVTLEDRPARLGCAGTSPP